MSHRRFSRGRFARMRERWLLLDRVDSEVAQSAWGRFAAASESAIGRSSTMDVSREVLVRLFNRIVGSSLAPPG